jgi:hypothetical protein
MGHGMKYIMGHGNEVYQGTWELSKSWDMGMG